MTDSRNVADFLGEDGCLRCGVCGKRKQLRINFMGRDRVVGCLCDCEAQARKEKEEQLRREEAQRELYQRKSVGLRDRRFWEWRFENDNGSNDKMLIARQYAKNWEKMKKENVGLLLMGPVGTGKSFFAGCIANALLEQGERVMMTNFSRILNEMTNYQADKNQIVQNLVDYPLLIIDDLGIERNSEFALEQIYNVIDSRYCKMKPLIITTNLGLNDMKDELFSKVKSGQVRFLLGSTAKMGAGTNVQDRLIALHHLDVGWKPSDLEQREGRIIRQANKITDPEKFVMEVGGTVFYEKKEAGAALLAVCQSMKQADAMINVGQYQGFSIRLKFDSWNKEFILSLKNENVYRVSLGSDENGNIVRINNALEAIPQKLAEAERKLETVQGQLKNAMGEVKKTFPKEEELNEKLERLSELNALLNMDEKETVMEGEEEKDEEKEEHQSLHDRITAIKQNSQKQDVKEAAVRTTEACIG